MDRGTVAVAAVVLLVVLAGCSSLLGGGGPDATPTATATPTEGPFQDVTFPTGTSADGIQDRAALLESHRTAINESSYEVFYSVDIRQGQQTVARRVVGTRSNLTQQRAYSVVTEPGRLAEAYRNESIFVTREFQGNESQYTVRSLDRPYRAEHARIAGTETIDLVLRNGAFTADAVVERRDGSTFIQYTLEEAQVNESANVSFATGSVIVSTDGVVHSAALRIEGTNNGARYLIDLQYRVESLEDVTVERPSWVDQALEA